MILVTAAILTVQSSMLQPSYAQFGVLDPQSQTALLDLHNRERAAVGVPPVTWSNSLAIDAQNYAQTLASRNLDLGLIPPSSNVQATGEGENLAWGTRGAFSAETLAQGWANEKANYVPGTPIAGNLAGPNGIYGHYTQMVWSSTTEIGCGMAYDASQDYLVCRYSPPGNILGQTAYGQGAPPPAATNATAAPATNAPPPATNAPPPAAVGEEQNTLGDQGAAGQDAGAPPADQAVVEEEVGGEVIQEQPPQ